MRTKIHTALLTLEAIPKHKLRIHIGNREIYTESSNILVTIYYLIPSLPKIVQTRITKYLNCRRDNTFKLLLAGFILDGRPHEINKLKSNKQEIYNNAN